MTSANAEERGRRSLTSSDRWIAWMQSDQALVAAFVASFLEMTIIPIPVETALTPAMLAAPRRRWGLAVAALAGSIACAVGWYLLASAVGDEVASVLGAGDELDELRRRAQDDGFGFVFFAGVTPIPFQLACIAAGAVQMSFAAFFAASALARAIRYFGLAALVALVGERARRWMLERKWALVLAMALVGGALFAVGQGIQALFSSS